MLWSNADKYAVNGLGHAITHPWILITVVKERCCTLTQIAVASVYVKIAADMVAIRRAPADTMPGARTKMETESVGI